MARVLVPLLVAGILVFTVVDIIAIEPARVKHLPKAVWVLIALLLPVIGSILWFTLGRERAGQADAGQRLAPRGPAAPDDDPAFLQRLDKDRAQEERIRDLERRLAELDDDDPKP